MEEKKGEEIQKKAWEGKQELDVAIEMQPEKSGKKLRITSLRKQSYSKLF